MINRIESPPYNPVGAINFVKPQRQSLANGIPVYVLSSSLQEMVRIEIMVNNVHYDPKHPLTAIAVASLLKNGTATLSALDIAEAVDELGAFLDVTYAQDNITITLYAMNKHLPGVLPVLADVLTNAMFPQTEIDIYKRNAQQRLQVNMQKNDFLSRKNFAHALFGDTAYGADITLADYEGLKRTQLLDYFAAAFVPQNYSIIASGNFQQADLKELDQHIGRIPVGATVPKPNVFTFKAVKPEKIFIERADAVQSAIRMGMIAIQRNHADYPGLGVLSCALGGYFGSRLMANIREEKGYTYGIGCGMVSLDHAGYFFIATEVGTDVCRPALAEIYKEIDILRTDLIGEDELNLVRNYMLGSLLGSLENVFSHADKFKTLLFSDLDYTYYERHIETVKTITPEALRSLAQQYLQPESFVELVVGKME